MGVEVFEDHLLVGQLEVPLQVDPQGDPLGVHCHVEVRFHSWLLSLVAPEDHSWWTVDFFGLQGLNPGALK